MEISALSVKFLCKPKTTLKYKVNQLKGKAEFFLKLVHPCWYPSVQSHVIAQLSCCHSPPSSQLAFSSFNLSTSSTLLPTVCFNTEKCIMVFHCFKSFRSCPLAHYLTHTVFYHLAIATSAERRISKFSRR